jgi:folate-binding protein YgfZ
MIPNIWWLWSRFCLLTAEKILLRIRALREAGQCPRFAGHIGKFLAMKAALLPDRGVVKVAGEGARNFLHGLVTADVLDLKPGAARFCALLTPQGKIIADFIITEAQDGGGFFLDVQRALCATLVAKLNIYKLRAKVVVEDLSEVLGVLAAWDGSGTTGGGTTRFGLSYADPRLPALGLRVVLPPHLAAAAAVELGATLVDAGQYEAHRIALGVPQGGLDFSYGDAFPHETDMDQLGGIDFTKGCYVGQEVVSRMEHRGTARSRAVPVRYDGAAPAPGAAVTAGDRQVGTMGSAAAGRALALLRLDRVAEAMARDEPLLSGDVQINLVKPDWARFAFPGETKAAE